MMRRVICSFGQYLLLPVVAAALAAGCGTGKAHVRPAKQVERDFYACKGFKGGVPVAATSEFSMSDGLVYVVADLEKEQVGNRLDFEVSAPLGKIAYFESVQYEQDRPYGIYFDTQKLLERGGPGRWRVLFWCDGQPVGRLFFNLEGPAEMAEGYRRAEVSSGNIFERLVGDEARPAELPPVTTEGQVEDAPPRVETPEGISLTPGEEVITPESEPAPDPGQEPEKVEEAAPKNKP